MVARNLRGQWNARVVSRAESRKRDVQSTIFHYVQWVERFRRRGYGRKRRAVFGRELCGSGSWQVRVSGVCDRPSGSVTRGEASGVGGRLVRGRLCVGQAIFCHSLLDAERNVFRQRALCVRARSSRAERADAELRDPASALRRGLARRSHFWGQRRDAGTDTRVRQRHTGMG